MLHTRKRTVRLTLGIFLSLAILTALFSVLPQTASATGGSDTSASDDLISVTVSWTSMSFSYTPPTWDPNDFTYGPGGWSAVEEDGGKVTVQNENDDGLNIKATVSYVPTIQTISGTLTENGDGVDGEFVVASGASKTLTLSLSGAPSEALNHAALGSVTVSIVTKQVIDLSTYTGSEITVDGSLHTMIVGDSASHAVPVKVTGDAVVTLAQGVALTTDGNAVTVNDNVHLKLRVDGTGHSITSKKAGGIILGTGSSLDVVGAQSAAASNGLTVKAGSLLYYPMNFDWTNSATVGIGAGVGKEAGDMSFQNLTLNVTGGNAWYAEVYDSSDYDCLYGSAAIGTSMAYGGLSSKCGNITFHNTALTARALCERSAVIGMGAVVGLGNAAVGDIAFNAGTTLALTMDQGLINHYGALIGFCEMTDYASLSLGKITFNNVTSATELDGLLTGVPGDFNKAGRYKVGAGWYDSYFPTNTPFGGAYIGSTVISDGAGYGKTSS